MKNLATFYPNLEKRHDLPRWWVPGSIIVFAVTPLIPGARTRMFSILPILIILAAGKPAFTAHSVSDDYGGAFPALAMPLAFLDFFVLSLLEGKEVRFMGRLDSGKAAAGVSEDDCTTTWKKMKWALRLATSMRGIGWDWQVKGVPQHPDGSSGRTSFVIKYLVLAAISWVCKTACLYVIGAATAAKFHTDSPVARGLLDVVVGWCGVSWAYQGLNANYRLGAALSVGVGMCEPWEWPPLFGSLREGWSVRLMWSSVWHQFIRRAVQTPGIRLARSLGLSKGTLGSKYLQLYLAFTLSMLLHEWFIFNAVRHDVGEFRFFMAQPFAITAEDFLQWCWRNSGEDAQRFGVAIIVGHVWTFLWFSYCLPPFVHGLLDVGIIGADVGGPSMMSLGRKHVTAILRS